MPGQPPPAMRLHLHQLLPGHVPIRTGGHPHRMPQGHVPRRQLSQLVISAVAVDQKDSGEAISDQRLDQVTQHAIVGLCG